MTEVPKDIADQYWADTTTTSTLDGMTEEEKAVFVRDYKIKMAALEKHYNRRSLIAAIAADEDGKREYVTEKIDRHFTKKFFVEVHIEDLDVKTLPEYQACFDRLLARVMRLSFKIPEWVPPCPYTKFKPQINWERK